ncbi:SAVMC3_10250 family protein [Amycolatopsis sp. NPDC051716]|jgi:hypothetical protein|uniref:SAVMC3_10250 family protein n=1 Tax=Amycolatopsis sp. NPDC051716 TaxID=3155804 RepID=UPI00344095AE
MRELVYLSRRKLRSFQPKRSRIALFRRVRETELKAPGIGAKFALSDAPESRHPSLAKVLDHLESSRVVRWYEDDRLQAGDWIQYEARLNYTLANTAHPIATEIVGPIVLFWDARQDDKQSTRLLLHGHPEHLVGQAATETPTRERSFFGNPSDAHGFREFVSMLESGEWAEKTKKWAEMNERLGFDVSLHVNLGWILSRMDRAVPQEYAAWMAGYARVTASMQCEYLDGKSARLVVASPLYVELVGEPSVDR